MDCLFCRISRKEINAKIIYEDDNVIAFDDIAPQAPYHKLIIPRRHIATVNDLKREDNQLIAELILTAKNIAQEYEFSEAGYRPVFNCNSGGGQMVYHLHLHLLGGRQMTWPPG